ncbi:hypothetical protein FRC07_001887 [Ceratobasidium sp. 392]|nr:hypothetical protein FRC07_001887 [Ceratobasidium sp. 392]
MTDNSQVSRPAIEGPGSVHAPIDIDSLMSDEDTTEQTPALPPGHEGNNAGCPPLPQSATRTHGVSPSAIRGDQPVVSGPAPEILGGRGMGRRLGYNSQPQWTPALRRFTTRPTPLAANTGLQTILSRARQVPYPTRVQAIDERKRRLARTIGPLTSSTRAAPSVPSTAPAPAAPSAAPAAAPAAPSAPVALAASTTNTTNAAPIQAVVVEEVRRLTYVAWGTPSAFTRGSGLLLRNESISTRNESISTRIVSEFGQSG